MGHRPYLQQSLVGEHVEHCVLSNAFWFADHGRNGVPERWQFE